MKRLLLLPVLAAAAVAQDDAPTKGDIARVVDEYLAARAEAEPSPFDRLSLYGDLRLRQEESFDLAGKPDRHRSRLRLRLGATWAVDDTLEVGARLVTGSRTDALSPHVTLGDGFEGLELSLDRAFATWRPEGAPDSSLTAGKFGNPARRNPVYGELLWDGDVQPEGLSIGQSLPGVDLVLGVFALQELATEDDGWITFAQAATEARLSSTTRARLSAAYTFVDDASVAFADNRGNATSMGAFASDFGVLDVVGDLRLEGAGPPWVLSLEWIDNLRADQDGNGWAAGVACGGLASAGDWRAAYQFQSIEQDAVFSPLAQDDFLRATGHASHLLSVERQLTDAIGLRLWGLVSEPEMGGDDEWRVRLDLNIKF